MERETCFSTYLHSKNINVGSNNEAFRHAHPLTNHDLQQALSSRVICESEWGTRAER